MQQSYKTVHAKSPLRLGLAGGGTDVAPYSDLHGGVVLNATINLFTHCQISLKPSGPLLFSATDFNESVVLKLASSYPLGGPLNLHKAVYNRIVRQFNQGNPLCVDVMTYSDVPPGSGIGSSSSLVVAMITAYAELLHLPLGEYDIAHLAYEIERLECGMAGGKQDQYAASFGGFNFIEFGCDDRVIVNPLRLREELVNQLESRILLYYTGRSRTSTEIIEAQISAARDGRNDATTAMHEIKQAALDMKEYLLRGNVAKVLDILSQSWAVKKRMAAGIANAHIDEIAASALAAGASGLKISGAGGGGFMMIATDFASRHDIIRGLTAFDGYFLPFTFTTSGATAWIVT